MPYPTAGGANGREAPVLLALPPGPRLPQYTMAPEEGPLATRPKWKRIRRQMRGLDSPRTKVVKEMEAEMQGTRELTNKEWVGGRERWETEPKRTLAKRRDFLLRSPS